MNMDVIVAASVKYAAERALSDAEQDSLSVGRDRWFGSRDPRSGAKTMSSPSKGALMGGLAGAGTGAYMGSRYGYKGALIGGGVGGLAGANLAAITRHNNNSAQEHIMRHSSAEADDGMRKKAIFPLIGAAAAKALPMIGMGAATAIGDVGARKLMGQGGGDAQGPGGPGGTGAGLEPGVAGPRGGGGATHGMLGFPKQHSVPKGGNGPPNFGNAHSRDRADPDLHGEGSGGQHPVAGFKLASAVLFEMGLVKNAIEGGPEFGNALEQLQTAGRPLGMAGRNLGEAAMSAGRGISAGAIGSAADWAGGAIGDTIGASGRTIMPDAAQLAGTANTMVNLAPMAKRYMARSGLTDPVAAAESFSKKPRMKQLVQAHYNRGVDKAIGEMPSDLNKVRGQVGQGINRFGQMASRNPRTTLTAAAALPVAYGLYRGGKALFGGGKKKEEEQVKPAASIMSNNLLDVLAFSMETAEKQAGMRFVKRGQGVAPAPSPAKSFGMQGAAPAPTPPPAKSFGMQGAAPAPQAGQRPAPPQLPQAPIPNMTNIQATRPAPAASAPPTKSFGIPSQPAPGF